MYHELSQGQAGEQPNQVDNTAWADALVPPLPPALLAAGEKTIPELKIESHNQPLTPGWENRVTVIGMGSYGTAISNRLASHGADVVGWARDPKAAAEIQENRLHTKFFGDTILAPNLQATDDLHRALLDRGVIIIALPSHAWPKVLPALRPHPDSLVISLTKGLIIEGWDPSANEQTLIDGPPDDVRVRTPLQYLKTLEHWKDVKDTAVVSGGGFSRNIVHPAIPFGLSVGSVSEKARERVLKLFAEPHLDLDMARDPLGIELLGSMKNVVAIAAGVLDGSDLFGGRWEPKVNLMKMGMLETIGLANWLRSKGIFDEGDARARYRTALTSAGWPDLVLTCTPESRNYRVGLSLGQGKSISETMSAMKTTAEGVSAAWAIKRLTDNQGENPGLTMLLPNALVDLFQGQGTPQEIIRRLYETRNKLNIRNGSATDPAKIVEWPIKES